MGEVELHNNRSAYKPSPEIIKRETNHIIFLEGGFMFLYTIGKVFC